jgi:hypothetical protein
MPASAQQALVRLVLVALSFVRSLPTSTWCTL